MGVHLFLTLLMAVVPPAAPPVAPPVATAQAPSESHTLQQDFDSASADAAGGKCQSAIAKFEALERNRKLGPGTLAPAAIAVRKGVCMIKADRADVDEPAMQAGLEILGKAGSEFDLDVADGWTALGNVAFARYDYAGATSAYRIALSRKKGEQRVTLLSKLAKVTAFDGNSDSLSYADEGIRIVSASPKRDKDSLSALHTLHARALLNQGRAEEAYKELKRALALSGGLTLRTTLGEVSLRSDLAMAAMLVDRESDARLYLAYTGAGRIVKSPFASAVSMDPPLCGEETGLRPDDVAVVEFSIADDGAVALAQTVYSRGGPAVAAAFGKAVSEWYWRAEDIAAIPPFYRSLTRIELRCSNVLGGGPGIMGPLRERFQQWAAGHLPSWDGMEQGIGDITEKLQKHKDESEARGDVAGQIAALGWLAYLAPMSGTALASNQKRVANADAALGLAATTSVPQEVVNWLRIQRLFASMSDKRHSWRAALQAMADLSNDPAIAKDALAADTLMLLAARGADAAKIKEAPALLQKVAQDDRLPDHHPLRQLAWLDLAGKAADDGDRTRAHEYFDRTGLGEEQCSLLGEAPTVKRSNVDSGDYPMEALRMGFEGWVRMEYDITTDGKTVNARPLVAYPPMVFVDAATAMAKNLRYDVSYRPGDSLACSAERQTFSFVIPTNH